MIMMTIMRSWKGVPPLTSSIRYWIILTWPYLHLKCSHCKSEELKQFVQVQRRFFMELASSLMITVLTHLLPW